MPVTNEILNKFNSIPLYIETGTDNGDSLNKAVIAGYKEIITIDIAECKHTRDRCRHLTNVKFVQGSSTDVMWDLIKDVNTQIVFYLDAHLFGDQVSHQLPLMSEIDIISKHHIKNHVIILDDVRLFETDMGLNTQNIINKLKEINPDYKISFADDQVARRDLLICNV
jgi:cephalosporin hydroxylase